MKVKESGSSGITKVCSKVTWNESPSFRMALPSVTEPVAEGVPPASLKVQPSRPLSNPILVVVGTRLTSVPLVDSGSPFDVSDGEVMSTETSGAAVPSADSAPSNDALSSTSAPEEASPSSPESSDWEVTEI